MSSHSSAGGRALAAAILITLSHCAASIDVPVPSITPPDSLCVPLTDVSESSQYTCSAPSSDRVHWVLGNYQAVDRTEFGTDGVTIGTGDSERNLTLIPSGLEFLFDRFDDTSFTVGCVAVVDNVNINRAESILVYRAVPPVDDPVWEVTSCGDDGSLTVHISYESISEDKVCDGQLNYTITLSNGGRYEFAEDDDLEMDVTVMDTADLSVAMTVCSNGICRNTTTQLSDVTCNRASWQLCEGGSDRIIPQCNFPDDTPDSWNCQFSDDDGLLAVSDERDDVIGDQTQLPSYDTTLADCSDNEDNDEDDEEDDDCPVVLAVVVAAVLSVLMGVAIGASVAAIVLLIVKSCKGSKNITTM